MLRHRSQAGAGPSFSQAGVSWSPSSEFLVSEPIVTNTRSSTPRSTPPAVPCSRQSILVASFLRAVERPAGAGRVVACHRQQITFERAENPLPCPRSRARLRQANAHPTLCLAKVSSALRRSWRGSTHRKALTMPRDDTICTTRSESAKAHRPGPAGESI